MDGIIIAGGIPSPTDPLYPYSQGKPKALIEVNGRTMLEHVTRACQEAQSVDKIIIVGIDKPFQQPLSSSDEVHFLSDRGSLIANVRTGLKYARTLNPKATHFMLCAADIPHLKGPMIDTIIDLCQPLDRIFYYTVATPEVVEARYPNSKRTYHHFKHGVQITGGDLFIAHHDILKADASLWQSLTKARKRGWKMARVVGFGPLLKFVRRQLSLEEAAEIGMKILGSNRPPKIIFTPNAEVAMDGDKPHQIELLRATF